MQALRAEQEKSLNEALVKKEEELSHQHQELEKELETLRSSLATAQQERDETVKEAHLKETQWKEKHTTALDELAVGHKTQLEELHSLTQSNMDNMTKMHEQHSQDHEARLQRVLTSHQEELQGLKDSQQTELLIKDEEYGVQLSDLEDKQKQVAEELAKALEELKQAQASHDQLKGENLQLTEVMNKLQDSMANHA